MKRWIDAQLSPTIAAWIDANFVAIEATVVRDCDLRDAEDVVIYFAARDAAATVMTKDSDFVNLQIQHGSPPKIIWITCGNTSNKRLKEILTTHLFKAVRLLEAGDTLVEISGQ